MTYSQRRFARIELNVLFALAVAGTACSLNDNSSNDSGTGDGTDGVDTAGDSADGGSTEGGSVDTSDAVSIYDVRRGTVAEGTRVTLSEVIVTSPINAEEGGVIVQEADGGEFSGIYLYMFDEVVGANDLQPGDVVNVVGEYSEFFGLSQITVAAIDDLSVVGSASVPEPIVVDAADIATGGSKAESHESVLVRIEDITVTNPDLMFGEFEVTGGLVVDDFFTAAFEPVPDSRFDSITGIVTYSFETNKLLPRTAADFVGGEGTGGGGPGGNDDDTDSDGNGGSPTAVSIQAIQQGDVAESDRVLVEDVIVTSPPNDDGDTFFVQEPEGGQWSGIAVYLRDSSGLSISVGDVVTVEGEYTEFFDLSEIVLDDVSGMQITGTADVPAAEPVSSADVATGGALQENYEGVLVEVLDATVTAEIDEFGDWQVDDVLVVGDLFLSANPPEPAVGDEFSSIVGVMFYTFDNAQLSPRSYDDLTQ